MVLILAASGISPMALFPPLQTNLLLLVGYYDYNTFPSNAFQPYYGLQSHILMSDHTHPQSTTGLPTAAFTTALTLCFIIYAATLLLH